MAVFSISRIRKFEECPRAYKFRYIEKPEVEEVRNIYGFLGSRVHETLEKLYSELMEGRQMTIWALLDYYDDIWDQKWASDVQIYSNKYSMDDYKQTGEECIRNYYFSHEPFDRDETVDIELNLRCELCALGEEYKFQGYVDRLARLSDGCYEVHDYKTSKNVPGKKELDQDRQLGLYQLAVHRTYPEVEEVELVWHYVRYDKELRSKRSEEELKELERNLVRSARKIDRAKDGDYFPPKRFDGARCDWCDYKDLCEAWNEGSKKESGGKLEDFL